MSQKVGSPPKNSQEAKSSPEEVNVKNEKAEIPVVSSDKNDVKKEGDTQKIQIQSPIEAMTEKAELKSVSRESVQGKMESKTKRKGKSTNKIKTDTQGELPETSVQSNKKTAESGIKTAKAEQISGTEREKGQNCVTRGIAHFENNMIRIAGGVKLHAGDEIKIGDKEFELRHLEANKKPLYWSVLVLGVIALFFIFQFGFTGYKDAGKIVGVVIDKETGAFLPNSQIQISDLGTKVKSNDLGFFVLDMIPPGTHEIKTHLNGFSPTVENAVVLKKQVTTMLVELSSEKKLVSTTSRNRQTENRAESGAPKPAAITQSSYGSIKIQSNVPDVIVYLNGEYFGKGNKVYSNISDGTHRVSLYKDGYQDWTGKVNVKGNRTSNLNVTLNRIQTATSATSSSGAVNYFALAQKEYNTGNYAGAVENYSKWISGNSDNAEAYWGRGNSYLKLGDSKKAIADFSRGAEVFEKEGNFNKAVLCYTNILRLNPGDMNSLYSRGLDYMKIGQHEQAVDDLKKVTEQNPKFFNGFIELGNAQYYSLDYKGAAETYSNAKKLNPNTKLIYTKLALTYTALKDKSEAKKNYEKFKELTTLVDREKMKDNPEWINVLSFIGESTEREF